MELKRFLRAAAFLFGALFLAISFVTFDGLHVGEELSPYANMGGVVGQAIADRLVMSFGVGAFAIAFFLLFLGYSVLVQRPVRNVALKCLGTILLAVALGTVVQAAAPQAGYARSVYPLGGVLGDLTADTLNVLFGGLGTWLLMLLVVAASAILATDTFLVEAGRAVPEAFADLTALFRRPAAALAGRGTEGLTVVDEPPAPTRRSRSGSKKATKAKTNKDDATTSAEDAAESKSSRRKSNKSTDEVDAENVGATGLDLSGLDDIAPAETDEAESAELVEIDEPDFDDEILVEASDGDLEDDEYEYEDDGAAEVGEDEYEEDDFDGDEVIEDDLVEEEAEEEEAEEEDEPEPEPDPVVIKTARRGRAGSEDVEILKISRAKHLEGKEMYTLPPLSLLDKPEEIDFGERDEAIRRKARKLEETLDTFGISAKVVEISRGPAITVYELALAAGTKVKRITVLPDDISMALKARTIRIVAPIPGKATVGIEVPNDTRETVFLRDLAVSDALAKKRFEIPLLLGKDATGEALVEDLTHMPHVLIAGQTGSGKSVCMNTIISSLLLTKYPEEVRLILIDPKMVELRAFRDVPHLMTPVVTDMKKAPKILDWAVNEMEDRYKTLAAASVRDIKSFNNLGEEEARERLAEHFPDEELSDIPTFLPYIVVVVDELADLMMMSAKEVETSICRLAQKSRAVGIHVILATQRPSVDVITGLIKSNMPSRLSFRTASKIDSRTILDQMGAERLLGAGDMLFLSPRNPGPIRCQAAWVSDREIKNLVRYIRDVAQPEYSQELTQVRSTGSEGAKSGSDRDPLYDDAIRAVLTAQRGSVSMLQRKLEIGYTRAARLVDFMAEDGIVGAYKGSKAREVLMTLEDWESQGVKD